MQTQVENLDGQFTDKFQVVNDYFKLPNQRKPFRERCQRKCCSFALWTKYLENDKLTEK